MTPGGRTRATMDQPSHPTNFDVDVTPRGRSGTYRIRVVSMTAKRAMELGAKHFDARIDDVISVVPAFTGLMVIDPIVVDSLVEVLA